VKILVLGGGGREHALVWRLARDPDGHQLLAAPGNPGISRLARCFPDVDPMRPADVLALAARERVDLTVVGPEAPLGEGIANRFREDGRAILGPSRLGAALETSKVHSKHFMARQRIPTPRFVACDTLDGALAAVGGQDFGFPVVIKADGLAAGKGVVIAADRAEAERAVRAAMLERRFGAAGTKLVIEECLVGPEVSCFALCDGTRAVALSSAQDHKRIGDDDQGPNTGGMGAFAPSPLMDAAGVPGTASAPSTSWVMQSIVARVLEGMAAQGEPYVGFLYVSLMLTSLGPQVIEFNVRFGDPEAQVVLPLIEGAFGRALFQAATGRLDGGALPISADRAVGVVLASGGYPGPIEPGMPIDGIEQAEAVPGAIVFHAGTKQVDDRLLTAGGRVLTVVGRGATFDIAMATAYQAAGRIRFPGMQFRRDIGRKAIRAAEVS
jgi:phosphoribosylamine--glycine ligase